MSSPFVLLDGHFFRKEEKLFAPDDLDNLLFTETIRSVRNQLMFWDDHLNLINLQLNLFSQAIPEFLKNDGKELKRQLERTLVKNKHFKSAQIDLSFYRQEHGIGYLARTRDIQDTGYTLNREGITLTIFDKVTKAASPLSALRIGSETYWKILQSATNAPSTAPILLNETHSLLETPGSNLFLLRDNTVSTPAPHAGTYLNPAQHVIRQICQKQNFAFQERAHLSSKDLLLADEVFLADDINGIRWVKAFEMKRYFNRTVKMINDAFNQELIH